jgi:hypothetical protein
MGAALVIANLDRAGDHAAALGMLVGVALVAGVVYGLIRLVGKSRAGRGPDA